MRLCSAVSMNDAGRKIVVSIAIPVRPGRRSSSASSTPLVTSRVLAQGNFSTTSSRPGPSLITASPISGWWSSTTFATSPSAEGLAVAFVDGDLGQVGRRYDRLDVPDREPLVGRVDEPAGADHRAVRELQEPGVERRPRCASMTLSSETSLGAHQLGSTSTVHLLQPLAPDRDVGHARARAAGAAGSSSRRSSTCRSATWSSTTGRSS